jgi:hypothetical protein
MAGFTYAWHRILGVYGKPRQSLMGMVRAEQEKHAAAARFARSSSHWNFWSGAGCFALSFLPHGIGTIMRVLAVIFGRWPSGSG